MWWKMLIVLLEQIVYILLITLNLNVQDISTSKL